MIRFFDLLFSLMALICLAPVFIVTVILLRVTGEGEVFFLQERIGFKKSKFKVYKFATMLKNSPNMGSGTITSKNDPRILPVGKILRKSKINELPQLLNVVFGQMSLIGPRPHADRDLVGVDEAVLNEVLSLRPGLSGIGSIVFRGEEKILQKFENPRPFYDGVIAPYKAELELWYKNKEGLSLYLKLIFLTLIQIVISKKDLPFMLFHDLPKMPDELVIHY